MQKAKPWEYYMNYLRLRQSHFIIAMTVGVWTNCRGLLINSKITICVLPFDNCVEAQEREKDYNDSINGCLNITNTVSSQLTVLLKTIQKHFSTSNTFRVKPIKKGFCVGRASLANLFYELISYAAKQMREQEVRLDGFLFGDSLNLFSM